MTLSHALSFAACYQERHHQPLIVVVIVMSKSVAHAGPVRNGESRGEAQGHDPAMRRPSRTAVWPFAGRRFGMISTVRSSGTVTATSPS